LSRSHSEAARSLQSSIDGNAAEYRDMQAGLARDSKERAIREGKVVEMLDNIQRGRRPYF
jgi:hypothetical protein